MGPTRTRTKDEAKGSGDKDGLSSIGGGVDDVEINSEPEDEDASVNLVELTEQKVPKKRKLNQEALEAKYSPSLLHVDLKNSSSSPSHAAFPHATTPVGVFLSILTSPTISDFDRSSNLAQDNDDRLVSAFDSQNCGRSSRGHLAVGLWMGIFSSRHEHTGSSISNRTSWHIANMEAVGALVAISLG